MEINWNTDRLIVLYYPQGASGKFLHGCVALSTQVEFQHKELINDFDQSYIETLFDLYTVSIDSKIKHQ